MKHGCYDWQELRLIESREMANKHPQAEIETTDMARMFPDEPSNFRDADANDEWKDMNESFDLIHIRGLDGAIKDWPATFAKAQRCLKPGGSVELGFMTLPRSKADKQLDLSSRLILDCETMGRALENRDRWKDWMQEAGFMDVVETRKQVPLRNSNTQGLEYLTEMMMSKMEGFRIGLSLSDMKGGAHYTQAQLRSMKQQVENAADDGAFIEV